MVRPVDGPCGCLHTVGQHDDGRFLGRRNIAVIHEVLLFNDIVFAGILYSLVIDEPYKVVSMVLAYDIQYLLG